jgi:hypothetical protein
MALSGTADRPDRCLLSRASRTWCRGASTSANEPCRTSAHRGPLGYFRDGQRRIEMLAAPRPAAGRRRLGSVTVRGCWKEASGRKRKPRLGRAEQIRFPSQSGNHFRASRLQLLDSLRTSRMFCYSLSGCFAGVGSRQVGLPWSEGRMRRREFIGLAGGAVASLPSPPACRRRAGCPRWACSGTRPGHSYDVTQGCRRVARQLQSAAEQLAQNNIHMGKSNE